MEIVVCPDFTYPLENLDLVAYPQKKFVLIMKDGTIYKNNLK